MDIKKEALRYLGYKGEPDEMTDILLNKAVSALEKHTAPKYIYKVMSKADCPVLTGNDIAKHTAGCHSVILFAATLGTQTDRLITAAQITDMAYAVVLDAVASAMIEEFCDKCEAEMKTVTGGNFTSRFSPGYGDFPITLQRELIRITEADKKIGLNTTESLMLVPVKSVTAVIGVSESAVTESKRGCENCNLKDSCSFRKENSYCENK